jgi:hypothetical protein
MKQVRFPCDDILCHVINYSSTPSILSRNDIKKRWYTQDDYALFKLEGSYCCMRLRKSGHDKLLDRVMMITCDDTNVVDPMTIQSNLLEWTELELCRGLETLCNVSHKKERARARARTIYSILRIQALSRDQGNYEDYVNEIRDISEHCTKSAREFAKAMALADEKAVQLELKRQPFVSNHISILTRLLLPRRIHKIQT